MLDSNEHQIRIINEGPGLISLALGNAYRIPDKMDARPVISKSPGGRRPGKHLFMIATPKSILSVPALSLRWSFVRRSRVNVNPPYGFIFRNYPIPRLLRPLCRLNSALKFCKSVTVGVTFN